MLTIYYLIYARNPFQKKIKIFFMKRYSKIYNFENIEHLNFIFKNLSASELFELYGKYNLKNSNMITIICSGIIS